MKLSHWKSTRKKEALSKGLSLEEAMFSIDTLLMFVCKISLESIYSMANFELSLAEYHQLDQLWKRFCHDEPIAYLCQSTHFWTLKLQITPDVLIPRSDSECFIRIMQDHIQNNFNHSVLKILELGAGSGALSLALGLEVPHASVIGLERSAKALRIAKKNLFKNKIKNVHFKQGDWWTAEFDRQESAEKFQIIFSNPPYICDKDLQWQTKSLAYEPKEALFSSENGYRDLFRIIDIAPNLLADNGILFLEHGFQQGQKTREFLLKKGYSNVETYRDLAQRERITMGQTPSFRN